MPQGRPVANAVAPGKRPRSSMVPTILLTSDGRFAGAIGSAGGNAILALCRQVAGRGDRLEHADAAGAGRAQPRRARRQLQRRGDQVLARRCSPGSRQRGIDLKPGQGEDSGLTGVLIRDGQVDGGADPAPRRRGADPAALGGSLPTASAMLAKPSRCSRSASPWRSGGRCPGPSIDHRRIELDEARAGADPLPRVVGAGDSADPDQRDLAARRRAERRAARRAPAASAERPTVRPASSAKRDFSGGRETVVLATMMRVDPVLDRDADDLVGLALAEVRRDLQEDRRPARLARLARPPPAAPAARPRPAAGAGPACWAS